MNINLKARLSFADPSCVAIKNYCTFRALRCNCPNEILVWPGLFPGKNKKGKSCLVLNWLEKWSGKTECHFYIARWTEIIVVKDVGSKVFMGLI